MVRNSTVSLGLLSSFAASLCCITPLVAAIGGVSGAASMFSWIDPARPYLIGSSLFLLGLAWFQKLRTPTTDSCNCEVPQKHSFVQSKGFLAGVTILAVLLMAFPSYSSVFYAKKQPVTVSSMPAAASKEQVAFTVKGMGCASCEPEVEAAVSKLSGILKVKASALKKNTVVNFDPKQTSIEAIRDAINSTGYTVQNQNH